MNTKLVLAIFGVALVVAALVGVTAAQFVGAQNQTISGPSQTASPYSSGNLPPYCYTNGTYTGSNQNGYGCYGYGYGAQNQNQYQYGAGMMGRTGYGMGRCW